MKNRGAPGYILLLSLMIIALSVILVTYMANKSMIHTYFTRSMIDREKAKRLAFSGIQLALSQLRFDDKNAGEVSLGKEQHSQKGSEDKEGKQLLENILPAINRWQKFTLKEEIDGLDGEIHICVSCEDGKIDINQLYDFEKHLFIDEGKPETDRKKIAQKIFASIERVGSGKGLFKAFEKFLKERHYKVDDVTELLMIKEFAVFKKNIFYEPPSLENGEKFKKGKRPLYLTDIFTTWSAKKTVEPWLFSDSLNGLLELERVVPDDKDRREKAVREWLENFKVKAQWSVDWDKALMPLYGKKVSSIPKEIMGILSTKFEPTVFSVLSYGKVGEVIQRLFAIIERRSSSDNGDKHNIVIKKVYWL